MTLRGTSSNAKLVRQAHRIMAPLAPDRPEDGLHITGDTTRPECDEQMWCPRHGFIEFETYSGEQCDDTEACAPEWRWRCAPGCPYPAMRSWLAAAEEKHPDWKREAVTQ